MAPKRSSARFAAAACLLLGGCTVEGADSPADGRTYKSAKDSGAAVFPDSVPDAKLALDSLPPTVQFRIGASSSTEGDKAVYLEVALPAAAPLPVSVHYAVTRSQARDHERCTPKDYTLPGAELVIGAGETGGKIALALHDDALFEGDEEIAVTLSAPENAVLGAQKTHVLTIVDDDRPTLVSVADHGAKADGKTDDRAAIQAAVDAVAKAGGGVVLFPPGKYLVGDVVILKPNITYFGYGATTLRPPNQGKWANTFRQEKYSSDVDSAPLVVQGFTMDGNSQNQGPYQSFELQQAHLISVMGNYGVWGKEGRVRVFLEDLTLQNGCGDGVMLVSNVDAHLCHVEARDVFRGGMTMTGGNSVAHVYDLTTGGKIDPTGIDVEVEGSETVELYMEKVRLLDGDFDVAMSRNGTAKGGIVELKDVVSRGSAFHMHTKEAKVRISDSEFWVGVYRSPVGNVVMQGKDVEFKNVTFHVIEDYRAHGELTPPPEEDRTLYALDALWNSNYEPTMTGQRVICDGCTFKVDPATVEASDKVYVMHTRWNIASQDNRIILKNPTIDARFDGAKAPECVQCQVDP
jgi:hypothetical protein